METNQENSKEPVDKWPELKPWLNKHGAKLMWSKKLDVARLGPTQVDCWLVNGAYAMIFYWPTSYNIYTAIHPAEGEAAFDVIEDAELRLLLGA